MTEDLIARIENLERAVSAIDVWIVQGPDVSRYVTKVQANGVRPVDRTKWTENTPEIPVDGPKSRDQGLTEDDVRQIVREELRAQNRELNRTVNPGEIS